MSNFIIDAKAISLRYPKEAVYALNSVSLTVETGSFFGLLGPNGSGKTTLISILCGLLAATAGHARVCGYDCKRQISAIKPLIGLAPQKIALYPSLTLYENLMLFASLYTLTSLQIKQQIEKCLQIVELETQAYKKIYTFSGGMMRRANLAASLLHNPKLLFLDEPTSQVDAHARNMIFKSLQIINASGVTIIYTSHYLEEIETLCTKTAILKQGKIIATDSITELKRQHPDKTSFAEIYLSLTES
ncbi:MAG: hypothetical protein A3E87_01405 [Gammaproteobacteria bacterium RIFCSPHIGHO2_12_FULL_35_23]|nr:MAG: hypothetical protein A3E87_01405 [Gammaproteobacteria bacterium RIFCSPHIGHO2_12_FULL_35_23]